MKNRIIRILLLTALALTGAFVIFIGVMWAKEYTPAQIEELTTPTLNHDTIHKDTLKIVSWNIGYAGLGKNTDFFYDGGQMVRDTREQTTANLRHIINFLQSQRDADFILLQEVDLDSKRSYYINQYDSLRDALPEFYGWVGLNYVSPFVPIPITSPMGSVKAGVVTLTKHTPIQVVRFQYPSAFSFPTRLFNLKRCLLSASFLTQKGVLYVNNTHNTAYDTGDMRSSEIEFLRGFLNDKPLSITAGDWNANPPKYTPSQAEITDQYFVPTQMQAGDLGSNVHFAYDTTNNAYTARYGYEPYNAKTTTRTVIDFAALGNDVKIIEARVIDLGFENSDHNPVVFTVAISQ